MGKLIRHVKKPKPIPVVHLRLSEEELNAVRVIVHILSADGSCCASVYSDEYAEFISMCTPETTAH